MQKKRLCENLGLRILHAVLPLRTAFTDFDMTTPLAKSPMPKPVRAVMIVFVAVVLFYFFFGFFVIRPSAETTTGGTIIYFRAGLNMPFIASAESLLDDNGQIVSSFARVAVLTQVRTALQNRLIVTLPYSEKLYYYSTDGKDFKD